MEMVDAEYSELDNIPEMVVSLTAAVRVQGMGNESNASTSHCNCKISVQQKDVLVNAY